MLDRSTIAAGYALTVLASTGAALGIALWDFSRARGGESARPPCRRGALAAHPLAQLGLVCLLLFVNQLLFNAYVLRAHGGDPSFLARYLGAGWCAVDDGPVIRLLASLPGAARWMSPSVLRVQAFLELPFTLFAYLSVARLLSSRVYLALTRLPVLALASLSFTAAFGLTELRLANPWTMDDLALRALACVVVPFYVRWSARRSAPPRDEHARGVLGLLVFMVGASAIAAFVLVVYDVFLLYNLAHLRQLFPILMLTAVVAVASARAVFVGDALAREADDSPSSPSLAGLRTALETFTCLFFVPSLAIRYWSFHALAQVCGVALVALALLVGLVTSARSDAAHPHQQRLRSFASLAVGLAAGGAGAALVQRTMHQSEAAIAIGAIAFIVPAIAVSRGVELVLRRPAPA